jgi:hypothetical protein
MRKTLLLTLILFSSLALGLPAASVIPASAASQGAIGKADAQVSPLDTSMTVPGALPGTSDPFASKSHIVKGGTFIVLATLQDVGVGDKIIISGHIYENGGAPINNAAIRFTINGAVLGAA